MPQGLVHGPVWTRRFALSVAVFFFTCSHVFGQAQTSAATAGSTADTPKKVRVRGCLSHLLDEFHFATEVPGGWFVLTGLTAGLEKYVDREMTLEGRMGEPIRIEGYFDPIPSFEVGRVVEVFEKPHPQLSASFTNPANWHVEINRKYGVKFAHPESMAAAAGPGPSLQPNFVTVEGTEIASSFEVPRDAYANANLLGGSFTIFVNRQLRNEASCMQFGQLGPREEPPTPYLVGKLKYLKAEGASAAMGTWYGDYYFHIFQSGVCYEFALELVEYNAHNADTGCNIPLLSSEDNLKLIKPLIASVSFFRPNFQRAPKSYAR